MFLYIGGLCWRLRQNRCCFVYVFWEVREITICVYTFEIVQRLRQSRRGQLKIFLWNIRTPYICLDIWDLFGACGAVYVELYLCIHLAKPRQTPPHYHYCFNTLLKNKWTCGKYTTEDIEDFATLIRRKEQTYLGLYQQYMTFIPTEETANHRFEGFSVPK